MTSYALPSFSEWLHHRDPQLFSEMNRRDFLKNSAMAVAGVAGVAGAAATASNMKDLALSKLLKFYRAPSKEHLIAYKRVNVLELIKKSVPNPEKFIKDFENLKKPDDQDIGMATRKQMFDKEIDMYVTTPEVIDSVMPGAVAYATPYFIVVPNTAFQELPSKDSYGKLTKDGAEEIAHELRHTTQDRNKVPNQRGHAGAEDYKQYMKDPLEMGVRLASAKNMCDKKYIMNFLSYEIKYHKARIYDYSKIFAPTFEEFVVPKQDFMQIFNEILPENEKEIFVMLMNPEMIEKALEKSIKYNQIIKKIKDYDEHKKIKETIINHIKNIQATDLNFRSLYDFYSELPPDEKIQFMHELLTSYDYVVHKKQPNKQTSFA